MPEISPLYSRGLRHLASAAMLVTSTAAALSPAAAASLPYPVGAYFGNPNGSDASQEATFEANYTSYVSAMQSKPTLITTYVDYTQPVTSWPSNASWQAWSNAKSPVAKTLEPALGFPMFSTASGAGTPDTQFKAFAAGTYDNEITGVIQAWKQNGFQTMVIRVGWEMNLQGTPYFVGTAAQTQADWVSAYQHIYTVLHRYATANNMTIEVAWNPGITNYSVAHATTALYPGDSYVDVVAADIYGDEWPYSDGGSSPTYHDWDTGTEDTSLATWLADPVNRTHYWKYPAATKWSLDGSGGNALSFSQLIAFAEGHHKPFGVSETGAGNCNGGHSVCDDSAFPQWLNSTLSSAITAGLSVAYVDIWNSNGGGNYQYSFSANNKPNELTAWKQYFGSPSH